ncbi:MAG: hypothetical protein ACXIT4_06490 [Erythrobacter sp.]
MADKTQQEIAEKALEMKKSDKTEPEYLERQSKHAGKGPIEELNQEEPVSGALDSEGHRPVLERSRKVR